MTDLVTGDTGSSIVVTCVDSVNSIINLTGSTVALIWENDTGAIMNKTMTIDDATNGKASYQFLVGEIFAPSMTFEIQITDSNGLIVSSSDPVTLTVREQIG